MLKARRISKYYYLRIKRLKGTPHSLALGAAIGVFIGLTPTMPFHTLLILILVFATRSSFIAGITVSWIVCNPLTYIPIYYFSVLVGNYVTPYQLNWEKIQAVLNIFLSESSTFTNSSKALLGIGYEAMIVLISGGFIFALPFGILSYYLALYSFNRLQQKRRQRRILQ